MTPPQYVLIYQTRDSSGKTMWQTYTEEVFETFDEALLAAHQAWVDAEEVLICGLMVDPSWEPPMCVYQTFNGSLEEPPEYCEEPVRLGTEACNKHQGEDT